MNPISVRLCALALATHGCGASSTGSSAQCVVYGDDDRRDVYDHDDPALVRIAKVSTVALMAESSLDRTTVPGRVLVTAPTLAQAEYICPRLPFAHDPTAATCSGVLIDDDLVLTAGHCVVPTSCAATKFVFNYYRPGPGGFMAITPGDVFDCEEVVVHQDTVTSAGDLDYAVVRLDRPATPDFRPARIAGPDHLLEDDTPLAVIGNGEGLPTKIDSDGWVVDARQSEGDYFVAEVDTFRGSSGSGVYDERTYTVLGTLVRGVSDYEDSGLYRMPRVCAAGECSGEQVTYVHRVIGHLCAVTASPRLCGDR